MPGTVDGPDVFKEENIPVDMDVFYSGHKLEKEICGGKDQRNG